MTEFSFDIALWHAWSAAIYWISISLGVISGVVALSNYSYNSASDTRKSALIVIALFVVMLGLFPIEWGIGTDRANYARSFLEIQSGTRVLDSEQTEVGLYYLSLILGKFLNVKQYFVAVAAIYLFNYYYAIRKLVQAKAYWLVIAVVISMGFTSYSVNTMRAGLALSFIVLSFAFYPSKWKMLACLFVASIIHHSAAIPSLMIAVSYLYPNTKLFYKLWVLSIPVSLVAGSAFMSFFAGMAANDRVSYLQTGIVTSYNVGFRVDFILYSLVPMAIGGYYIFKRGFNDRLYRLIYDAYLLTNIFWILVIRANFSDRFAYLSWFMIPFILVYPLLKADVVDNPRMWLGLIILGETVFRTLI